MILVQKQTLSIRKTTSHSQVQQVYDKMYFAHHGWPCCWAGCQIQAPTQTTPSHEHEAIRRGTLSVQNKNKICSAFTAYSRFGPKSCSSSFGLTLKQTLHADLHRNNY